MRVDIRSKAISIYIVPHQARMVLCQATRELSLRMSVGLLLTEQATLTDALKLECGWLQLSPTDEVALSLQRVYFGPNSDDHGSLSSLKIELVAVCHRRKSCPFCLSDKEECDGYREFYGVLGIKWTNRVAYQRGCGYVIKEMWDRHELDEIDLVLGQCSGLILTGSSVARGVSLLIPVCLLLSCA